MNSTCVQLQGKCCVCRHLSARKRLDTCGHDLIFCYVMVGLVQGLSLWLLRLVSSHYCVLLTRCEPRRYLGSDILWYEVWASEVSVCRTIVTFVSWLMLHYWRSCLYLDVRLVTVEISFACYKAVTSGLQSLPFQVIHYFLTVCCWRAASHGVTLALWVRFMYILCRVVHDTMENFEV